MTWNYRIMEMELDGEPCHVMVEAYYDEGEPEPHSYCEVELIYSEVSEGGLAWTLEHMKDALNKPVLKWEDFHKEE